MVLRRELGGNAVGEKSIAGGNCGGLKNQPHWFRGDFEITLELYCIFHMCQEKCVPDIIIIFFIFHRR